jgi:hypothetical protein
VNEGYGTLESCIERERCEMTVEWIEVWALYAVRYTRFILVCLYPVTKRPTLVRVPSSRLFLNLAEFATYYLQLFALAGYALAWRAVSCQLTTCFFGVRFLMMGRIGCRRSLDCLRCVYTCFIIVLHSFSLKRPTLVRVTS